MNDIDFMKKALQEAEEAKREGEIPVGAVIVCKGRIIARAHNETERLHDVTAHAEILAITAASNRLGGKYLNDCTLYVTLEPCIMCAGALAHAQIGKIIYGASDPQHGFLRLNAPILHPKTLLEGGLLSDECSALLTEFFHLRR